MSWRSSSKTEICQLSDVKPPSVRPSVPALGQSVGLAMRLIEEAKLEGNGGVKTNGVSHGNTGNHLVESDSEAGLGCNLVLTRSYI